MSFSSLKKVTGLLLLVVFLAISIPAFADHADTPVEKAEGDMAVSDAVAVPESVTAVKKSFTVEEAIALVPKLAPGETPVHGKLNMEAPKGFLGIPGAPNVPWYFALFWAIFVGWIFSTVGAFGGVMAAVGHTTIFGLGSYASSFGKGNPLNTTITDSIRVSNQCLVGTSAAVASFNYWKMKRLVLPLALALGFGSVFGSILVPMLTRGAISFKAYQGYFGLFVLFLGCFLFWQTTPSGQATKKKGKAAADAFEKATKDAQERGDTVKTGVEMLSVKLNKVLFNFCGVEFSFNPILVAMGGFLISCLAAFLGVGGGFLLVPFLTTVTQLPMYLAAGTSSLIVLIGMVTSISTFLAGGAAIFWPLVGVELIGIVIGSIIGPKTSKYLSDKWMTRIFILLAVYVGLDFTLKGFAGKGLITYVTSLFGA